MTAPVPTLPAFRPAGRLGPIALSEIVQITCAASARERAGRPGYFRISYASAGAELREACGRLARVYAVLS